MSENVTHVAVCDDVTRLAALHTGVPAPLNDALRRHAGLARLGAATRSADKWSAEIVAWARDHWSEAVPPVAPGGAAGAEQGAGKEAGPRVDKKLAYVLGALTHRAADRLFKPIFQYCRERYGEDAGIDCSIHCDVLLFREVYGAGSGGDAPLAPGLAGSGLPTARVNPYQRAVFQEPEAPQGQELEALFRTLWQRALISMHTFSPDSRDMLGWLDRLLDVVQPFYLDLDHYRRVHKGGLQTEKFRRYIYETNSYDPADPLVRLARDVQAGKRATGGQLEHAMDVTTDASSRYARALRKGLGYLLAAGELWRGEIDVDGASRRFDVGVPERSLVFEPSQGRPEVGAAITAAAAAAVQEGQR